MLQASSFHSLCFLADTNIFFFVAEVNNCFLIGVFANQPYAIRRRRIHGDESCNPARLRSCFMKSLVLQGLHLFSRIINESSRLLILGVLPHLPILLAPTFQLLLYDFVDCPKTNLKIFRYFPLCHRIITFMQCDNSCSFF